MKILLSSQDELTRKGYRPCGATSEQKNIVQNGIQYNLAGRYSVKVEKEERCLLIVTTILKIFFTLGFALCSSTVRANLQGRRIDTVYVKASAHTVEPKPSAPPYSDYRSEEAYAWRTAVYKETLKAAKEGYRNRHGEFFKINNEPMLKETVSYPMLPPLPAMQKSFTTSFSVFAEDTLKVLVRRRREGGNPAGINMAHRSHPGGGVETGCPAQEESLCRRSNHILGLLTQDYPIPLYGGIYCPHVHVFRDAETEGCAFMDKPEEVALVALAAYDLREKSKDRADLGLPLFGPISIDDLKGTGFENGTKLRVRNMLRIMALKGHTQIVLGAFGCGAFKNPPALIAKFFLEVFKEPEFQGRFKTVDFAILKIFEDDQKNIDAFSKICSELNISA